MIILGFWLHYHIHANCIKLLSISISYILYSLCLVSTFYKASPKEQPNCG